MNPVSDRTIGLIARVAESFISKKNDSTLSEQDMNYSGINLRHSADIGSI